MTAITEVKSTGREKESRKAGYPMKDFAFIGPILCTLERPNVDFSNPQSLSKLSNVEAAE